MRERWSRPIPGSSNCAEFLPFHRLNQPKGINFAQLEDLGISPIPYDYQGSNVGLSSSFLGRTGRLRRAPDRLGLVVRVGAAARRSRAAKDPSGHVHFRAGRRGRVGVRRTEAPAGGW